MLAQDTIKQFDGFHDLTEQHPLDVADIDDLISKLLKGNVATGKGSLFERLRKALQELKTLKQNYGDADSRLANQQRRTEELSDDLATAARHQDDAAEILSQKRQELEQAGVGHAAKDLEASVADLAQKERASAEETATLRAKLAAHVAGQEELQKEVERLGRELAEKEDFAETSWAALAGDIQEIAGHLQGTVREILTRLLPSEDAVTVYALQSDRGIPADNSEVLEQLMAEANGDAAETPAWLRNRIKLRNTKLENHLTGWMDHLSVNRVAEEMDSATYIQRLRGLFQRSKTEAKNFGGQISDDLEKVERAQTRLTVCHKLLAHMTAELRRLAGPRGSANGDQEIVAALSKLSLGEHAARIGGEFANRIAAFFKDACKRMNHLQTRVCSEQNLAVAEDLSYSVSRDIEQKLWWRPWPYLVAIGAFFGVKAAFAQNTYVNLHDLAVPLLTAAPVLAWIGSVLIGRHVRERRMTKMRAHTRSQIAGALALPPGQWDAIVFESTELNRISDLPDVTKSASLDVNANRRASKAQAFGLNLAILFLPAGLWLAINQLPQDNETLLIARFPSAEPCILAEGHVVFATPDEYFVRAGTQDPIELGALDYLFPELPAQTVLRANIVRVVSVGSGRGAETHSDSEWDALLRCTQPDPDRRDLRLTHSGNAIGALGFDGVIADLGRVLAENSPPPSQIALHVTASDEMTAAFDRDTGGTFVITFGRPDTTNDNGAGENGETPQIASAVEDLNEILGGTNQNLQSLTHAIQAGGWGPDQDQFLGVLRAGQATFLADFAALAHGADPSMPQIVFVPYPPEAPDNAEPQSPIVLSVTNNLTTQIGLTQNAYELGTLDNTLILPLFLKPMDLGGDISLDRVFDWGANSELDDPEMPGVEGSTLLGHIAMRLGQCLEQDRTAILSLDIRGMASRSWRGETDNFGPDSLNHFLGEGRRAAILTTFAAHISDPGSQQRVLIRTRDDGIVNLGEFVRALGDKADRNQFVGLMGRYSDEVHFVRDRDAMFSERIDPINEGHPLEELLARSVVLTIEGMEGDACRF